MFRVQASHEAAIVIRNTLAEHTNRRIITNRHPGSDHFHIEMDQDAAQELLDLIRTRTTTREDHTDEPVQFRPLSRTRPSS
jgi:hypothetical protein